MDQLLQWDKELFIFFNQIHADWADPVMLFLTHTLTWTPLYIFLVYSIIKTDKKLWWIGVSGIVLTILLSDQITAGLMKPYFERLRPSQDPTLRDVIHLVNGYKGGMFGFASSHAANTFGTAMFFHLTYRNRWKFTKWLFLYAALHTYTRLYLGVHFPGDILAGIIVGLLAGIAGNQLYKGLARKFSPALITG